MSTPHTLRVPRVRAFAPIVTLGLVAACAGSGQVPFNEAGLMPDTTVDTGAWSTDLLPAGDPASSRQPLVSYEYLDGSRASRLLVLDDGTLAQLERDDGAEVDLAPEPLLQAELDQLKEQIASAGAGFVATVDSAGGPDVGQLLVYTSTRAEVIIRRVNKSTTAGAIQPSRFEYNTADAADRIHDLVDRYVTVKMPRNEAPAP